MKRKIRRVINHNSFRIINGAGIKSACRTEKEKGNASAGSDKAAAAAGERASKSSN